MNNRHKISRFVKTVVVFVVCMFVTTHLSAFFVSYISYKPGIILLGENHQHEDFIDGEQIRGLFGRFSSKSNICTVLVEDACVINPQGGNWRGILPGLIQRLSSELDNQNIQTVCLERNLVIYTTAAFFNYATFPPSSGIYSPNELKSNSIKNCYEYTFDNFFEAVDNQVRCLKEIRSNFNENYDICMFIDFMTLSMEDAADKLKSTLAKYGITQNQSILQVATQTKLAERLATYPFLLKEIVKVSFDLDIFMSDYMSGLSDEAWKSRVSSIDDQISVVFSSLCELMNVPHGCFEQFKESVCDYRPIKALFNKWELRKAELISRADAFKELDAHVFDLRMLCFDAFAVLDVVKYAEFGEVYVVAGDMHVQNISNYLTNLGFQFFAKPEFEYGFVPPNYF